MHSWSKRELIENILCNLRKTKKKIFKAVIYVKIKFNINKKNS